MDSVNHDDSALEAIVKKIDNEAIQFVRFEFGDMNGVSRCTVIPSRHMRDKSTHGINIPLFHFAMDSAYKNKVPGTGYTTEIGGANGMFVPDLSTFYTVPWSRETALVLTEPSFHGKPVTSYPRYIARQQINRLSKMGYSLFSAHEHEFYVFGAESQKPIHKGNMRSSLTFSANSDLLYEFSKGLTELGIDVEALNTKSSPGQFEISFKPAFGVRAADNAYLCRMAIKEIAQRRGYIASFMSKPWPDEKVSSAHFNHSLWDIQGSKNMMYDPSSELGISKVTEHWIAGILAHGPAISLFMAPTTNCRKRYKPGSVSSKATWGIEIRTCALRLNRQGEDGTYLENRLATSCSNPYLSLAATVAAGIDGIKRELPLPDRVTGSGDIKEDVSPGTQDLPGNLRGAVEAFEEDCVIREAFGEEFCRAFLAIKRYEIEQEKKVQASGDTEWEFRNYFAMM